MAQKRKPRTPISEVSVSTTPYKSAKKPATAQPIPAPITSVTATPARRVVQYGKKIIEEVDPAKWRPSDEKGERTDMVLSAAMEMSAAKFGGASVTAANESQNLIIGIPCPLVMEYLYGHDIFAFGVCYQIVGEPGSGKTPLLYEHMKWVRNAGGGSFLAQTERVFSREFLQSIVGFRDDEKNVIVDRCNSVEDWQQRIIFNLRNIKNLLAKKGKAGRTMPLCLGIDSVSGVASFATQEKVNEQGHGSPMHPREAYVVTQFMKTVPSQLDDWPFALVLVNHLKNKTNDRGFKERNITGGKGLLFRESFELEVRDIKRILCTEWEGVRTAIICPKTSYGPSDRAIETLLMWKYEDYEAPCDTCHGTGTIVDDPCSFCDGAGKVGKTRQVSWWDWNWSLVHLLTTKGKLMYGERMASLDVHIAAPRTSDVENCAWSRSLGMKEEDAVSWTELGAMIMANPALVARIRRVFGIHSRPLLAGDYLLQREQLKKELP